MSNPYEINEPTCISFSGGRTSAYMLYKVLEAHQMSLPSDAIVCFANTGKEDEATLKFVHDIETKWNVPIHWIEYRNNEIGFAKVDYETASRDGEPFEELIHKVQFLPNSAMRICTTHLKIRPFRKYLDSINQTVNQFVDWIINKLIVNDETLRFAKKDAEDILGIVPQLISVSTCSPQQKNTINTFFENITQKFLSSIPNDFLTELELVNSLIDIANEWKLTCFVDNPQVKDMGSFLLTNDDFTVAKKKNYTQYLENGRNPICIDFAFYNFNEKKAFDNIFHSKPDSYSGNLVKQTVKTLRSFGYKQTIKPHVGGLVVYTDCYDETILNHMGIITNRQTIISKWGDLNVIEHPIEYVFSAYGNTVSFFEKDMNIKYQEVLTEAENALDYFDHSFVYSPLTTTGCQAQMLDLFRDHKVDGVFDRSIYNQNYHKKVRDLVLKTVEFLDVSVTIKQFLALAKAEIAKNARLVCPDFNIDYDNFFPEINVELVDNS
ncbi:MAG: hypothetical protein JHC93_03660 [Parachlamydiales bacterium]|nr:hypothetical protein [Parachlamydiales bacterium]